MLFTRFFRRIPEMSLPTQNGCKFCRGEFIRPDILDIPSICAPNAANEFAPTVVRPFPEITLRVTETSP